MKMLSAMVVTLLLYAASAGVVTADVNCLGECVGVGNVRDGCECLSASAVSSLDVIKPLLVANGTVCNEGGDIIGVRVIDAITSFQSPCKRIDNFFCSYTITGRYEGTRFDREPWECFSATEASDLTYLDSVLSMNGGGCPPGRGAAGVRLTKSGACYRAAALYCVDLPWTFGPDADAYVRNGAYGSQNFGTATTLPVKYVVDDPDYSRRSYLRFNLGSLGSSVRQALLKVYVESLEDVGTPRTVKAVEVVTDAWAETGITWCNQPAYGAALDIETVSVTGWVTFDVTGWVNAQLAGDKRVSIGLFSGDTLGRLTTVSSREVPAHAPVLVVTP